jgi:hypothetical protein
MVSINIANSRLINQQIAENKSDTVKEIVRWMGAIQAQDYPMAKWAIGLRLPNSSDRMIENALNNGEIIRIHLLRPTWHFVSADDVYWMLELSAPQIRASIKSRHKQLELTKSLITKSNDLIEKILSREINLTREELAVELARAKIKTNNNRLSHFLLIAELDGIICSGIITDRRQSYALLPVRVPHKKLLSRDESLAALARRYFSSHGPASLSDFIWWSDLPAAAARHALESVKSHFISETINSQEYWFTDSLSKNQFNKTSLYILPAYDEFLIGYKDRSTVLSATNNKKTVSNNGVFRPVIVIDGLVQGIWKRTSAKGQVMIEANFSQSPGPTIKNRLKENVVRFGRFLNKQIYIKYLIFFALLHSGFTSALGQTCSLHGQASAWILSNPAKSPVSQTGLRYIPEGSLTIQPDSDLTADLDIALNGHGSAAFTKNRHTEFQKKVKLYRAWLRIFTNRFEIRAGLQKINFGSAILFRPLMWFDRVDPRDPLQLTDGVYALLARYYFLNNTNIWLWGLYGNEEIKGWEFVPTAEKSVEYGGRLQIPLASGELAASYHQRRLDPGKLTEFLNAVNGDRVPEDRFALDGKWDLGIGAWFEAVLIHRQGTFSGLHYQRQWTVGTDYTFDIGNGLTTIAEHFRSENPDKPFSTANGIGFSGLSFNYPLNLLDRLSCMLYRDWTNREWYRLFTWQRAYDNWLIYLLGFWNPEKIKLYQASAGSNPFSGTGIQLMIVFNH